MINYKKRISIVMWISILLFVVVVLTFPKWITMFYPQPHRDIVYSVAYEYKVDPNLVFAIIRAESKFQTGAESKAGAKGLMQIMPDTANWIAEQQGIKDFNPDSLVNPEVNIHFGCWYLNNLNKEFEDNQPLVIAAYNAGRGHVRQWLINDVWNGDEKELEKIPFTETAQYVNNVLKNYEAYKAIYN